MNTRAARLPPPASEASGGGGRAAGDNAPEGQPFPALKGEYKKKKKIFTNILEDGVFQF